MRRILLFGFLCLLLNSCGSSKRSTSTTQQNTQTVVSKGGNAAKKVTKIIRHAKSFEGTRYKFGGTDKRGMDCSGLVYVSFNEENIALPRVSRDMAKKGVRIKLRDTQKGDLVFFRTNKNAKNINHVGLVVESKSGTIKFIHSTSSRGVIISSLKERYWNEAFVEVRRII